jgi:secondary thiamine-phosphate synthase enzyme
MELAVVTQKRCEALDITRNVQQACRQWGGTGAVLVYCPHTTASVAVNEKFDPTVAEDILGWFGRMVPEDAGYKHAEGNADAHIKSLLGGNHVLVPVRQGNLLVGRWQGVFFLEFDGPRHRTLWLNFLDAAADSPTEGKKNI